MKKYITISVIACIIFILTQVFGSERYNMAVGIGYVADGFSDIDIYTEFSQIFDNPDINSTPNLRKSTFKDGEIYLKLNYGYNPNAVFGLDMNFEDGYCFKTSLSANEGRGRFYIEKNLKIE